MHRRLRVLHTLQVMQANESGLIELDAPIERYVDPVMQRLNGTTMLQMWGGAH
jgi:hypothetical protein